MPTPRSKCPQPKGSNPAPMTTRGPNVIRAATLSRLHEKDHQRIIDRDIVERRVGRKDSMMPGPADYHRYSFRAVLQIAKVSGRWRSR